MLFDERHGVTMDWATHEYLHRTRGAAIANGLLVSLFATQTGNLATDGQINVSSGTFFDEDLQVDIPSVPVWNQIISGPGQIPVVYKSGVTGEWRKSTATTYPILYGTFPKYNLNTGGNWTSPDGGNGKYIIYWIAATNMVTTPVISVMGQNEYSSLNIAQQVQWSDLNLTGFPIVEFRPLARVIYELKNSYNSPNPFRAIIADITDIRTFNQIGGAAGEDGPTGPTITPEFLDNTSATGTVYYNPDNSTLYYTSGKTFVIDHPVDKSKYLIHACLEGPESGVYYRGEGEIKNNERETTIILPNYVENLANNFTVQVTGIYDGTLKNYMTSRVENNRFKVYGDDGNFFWTVFGKRSDIQIEIEKEKVELKGSGPYLWI